MTDPKVVLGKSLFFSKSLGGDQDTACVSCHHPAMGGSDDLSLPIGVGADSPELLGPGRTQDGGSKHPTVPRNAPTTYNVVLWDDVLFHDGRVESLGKTAAANGNDGMGIRTPDSAFGVADPLAGETLAVAQARFPVTSDAEMRGHSYARGDNATLRARLQSRLQDNGDSEGEINVDIDGDSLNNWVQAFETVYPTTEPAEDIITFERVADAIGAYENSQLFIENPWKSYIAGDTDSLSTSAKRGAVLFYSSVDEGGAGCVSCHSGDVFTDESFHNVAMPQIGEGKGDSDNRHDDFGRMRETGLEADKYGFRTPSLLNVEHTGPFGHAGAYETLADTIKQHIQPSNSIDDFFAAGGLCSSLSQLDSGKTCEDISGGYAETNTRAALAALQQAQENGSSMLVNVELEDGQIEDLVSFLEALTDPCLEDSACIGQWIPDDPDSIDGNGLNAVDAGGNPFTSN